MQLNQIEHKIDTILKEIHATTATIDTVKAAAAATETEIAAAITAIQTETANITALTAQVASLQAAIAAGTPVNESDLQEIQDGLDAATANLTAALPVTTA